MYRDNHKYNIEVKINTILKYFMNQNIFRYAPKLKTEIVLKLRNHIILNQPLKFLIYWGVGTKNKVDEIDVSAIEFQQEWMDEFTRILELDYEVDYIISDTHANVNSIPTKVQSPYIKSIEAILQSYKYSTIKSSHLLKKYDMDMVELINNYNIDNILNNQSYCSMIKGLKQQSKNHSYVGDDTSYVKYFKVNLIENAMICNEYPHHIFITYKSPQEKMFLPSLPKIYTYVNSKKQVKRPWFSNQKMLDASFN